MTGGCSGRGHDPAEIEAILSRSTGVLLGGTDP